MKSLCNKLILIIILLPWSLAMQAQAHFVAFQSTGETALCLSGEAQASPIVMDEFDFDGVQHAVGNLKNDLLAVTGQKHEVGYSIPNHSVSSMLIVGSLPKSKLIRELADRGKIDGKALDGCYEKYMVQVVEQPFPNVERALVIAGSDQRGTIYGVYALSEQIGVSPWYYWADVPIGHHKDIYILPGIYTNDEPKVKYRGIFLNDEAPALSGWVHHTFGGFNHLFYEKVFELILRLKGNYIWPAMWGRSFYDDDPENGILADRMGIVVGTSHHEPMGRAHAEWKKYGSGGWNYEQNAANLNRFWEGGLRRMNEWEKVVTIGMRGDGDEPMSERHNIALLEQIIKQQRKLIASVTGKEAAKTPQVWALYKEVQDYYDRGMRVPNDVTLLLCDDNWGNLRKLPNPASKPHPGGYGIYYHFDYVGGPRNYKWLNVTQIQRVWEQMILAYHHDVDRMWIVNVGDLKPMEYPITFFLDMAWNPAYYTADRLFDHTIEFCKQQFGGFYASESARLIDLYCKYNSRITPELLDWNSYSLSNYNEFETVVREYQQLLTDALKINYLMPAKYRDAFDQLVLFPIHAMTNLYEMYYAVACNHHFAKIGAAEANQWAKRAKECYVRDSLLTLHYNCDIANGKWLHMMDQVHIGYSGWQQPDKQIMPPLMYVDSSDSITNEHLFIENNGFVSIESNHFSRQEVNGKVKWVEIPNLGKTQSAMTLQTSSKQILSVQDAQSYLEYDFELKSGGNGTVNLLLSPSLNFNNNQGLKYAISINGGEEQIVNYNGTYDEQLHNQWVANRIIESVTVHHFPQPGRYTLRFRALDVGVVLQKLVIDLGGVQPSFLGPRESTKH